MNSSKIISYKNYSVNTARKLRYFRDQKGIYNRYLREMDNWNEHLSNSKRFIEQFVAKHPGTNVGILGSGWLLDVPVCFLAERCSNVFLYDVRHPARAVHQCRKFPNVFFVKCDITGGMMAQFYQLTKALKKTKQPVNVHDIIFTQFEPSEPLDVIISLNILNQLDILLIDGIRQYGVLDPGAILGIRAGIQQQHIDGLKHVTGCMITDVTELLYDDEWLCIERRPLIFTDLPYNGIT
jgi:hypothetical protein